MLGSAGACGAPVCDATGAHVKVGLASRPQAELCAFGRLNGVAMHHFREHRGGTAILGDRNLLHGQHRDARRRWCDISQRDVPQVLRR